MNHSAGFEVDDRNDPHGDVSLRVFVCEFVTGGGFAGGDLPDGLRAEGDMMLRTIVKDLSDLPGIHVSVVRDRRLPLPDLPVELCWIEAGGDPWPKWRQLMADAQAVLPIAPETDRLLERLTALALDAGSILLGSRLGAVRRAASKTATVAHLARAGIATVATCPAAAAFDNTLPAWDGGWVAKPDDGAGCEETLLLPDTPMLRRWLAELPDPSRFVVQPYLAGRATSLCLLCGDGRALLLSCNEQDMRIEAGRLHYRGGVVGGREADRHFYEPIAARIAAAMPELWGFVGVDLVETASGPIVLEVNPRLTTSYAGLRQFLGHNPAALLLQLATGGWEQVGTLGTSRQAAVRVVAHAA